MSPIGGVDVTHWWCWCHPLMVAASPLIGGSVTPLSPHTCSSVPSVLGDVGVVTSGSGVREVTVGGDRGGGSEIGGDLRGTGTRVKGGRGQSWGHGDMAGEQRGHRRHWGIGEGDSGDIGDIGDVRGHGDMGHWGGGHEQGWGHGDRRGDTGDMGGRGDMRGDTWEDRGDMWGHGVGDRDRDGDMG